MKKRMMKSIAIIFAVMAIFVTSTLPANAAYSYYGRYDFSTGALWWTQKYTAKVYRDPTWFRIYYGSPFVSTGFEYKNNTNVVLSQTRGFSLGSQTKATLSTGVNFDDYGVPVNVGGSIEKTSSASWAVSNQSSRTIPADAPKGYYSYNVCLNTHKIKITRYQGNTSKGTIEFYAPRSQPYRSIVYNKYNASYSSGAIRY